MSSGLAGIKIREQCLGSLKDDTGLSDLYFHRCHAECKETSTPSWIGQGRKLESLYNSCDKRRDRKIGFRILFHCSLVISEILADIHIQLCFLVSLDYMSRQGNGNNISSLEKLCFTLAPCLLGPCLYFIRRNQYWQFTSARFCAEVSCPLCFTHSSERQTNCLFNDHNFLSRRWVTQSTSSQLVPIWGDYLRFSVYHSTY